jgi:DNA gyrase subunit A
MVVNERNGRLIASFPVSADDQIMLVTDAGKTIRTPVEGDKPIRIASRSTQGVILFDTDEGEKVVSVEHIPGEGENGENGENGADDSPEGSE